jgi:uncharacterized protein YjbJ (UPF0337 family)
MGEITDKVTGRAKQAAGAITGDDETRREGARDERKGDAKGAVNDAADKVKDGIDSLKDKASRA